MHFHRAGRADFNAEFAGNAFIIVEKDLADRLLIFISPKVIGGRTAVTSVEGSGILKVKDAKRFNITNVTSFKEDILIEAER